MPYSDVHYEPYREELSRSHSSDYPLLGKHESSTTSTSGHDPIVGRRSLLLEDEEENKISEGQPRTQEDDEYVRYGDKLCFLCEGQLLAMTRKLNLTYQQMVLLLASTVATFGVMGVASFFVWKKGLFRKKYAALSSASLYSDKPQVTDYQAVSFRLFEYDESNKCVNYRSIGQKVRYGVPLVIIHAHTQRVMRFKPHKQCVTLGRLNKHPDFERLVAAAEDSYIDEDAVSPRADTKKHRHQSMSASAALSKSASTYAFGQRTPLMASYASASSVDSDATQPSGTENEGAPPARRSSLNHQPISGSSNRLHPTQLYRSISESCSSFVQELNLSIVRQRDRARERKRRRLLLKDMPNVLLDGRKGQHFLGMLRPVHTTKRFSASSRSEAVPNDEYLRWGAPLGLLVHYSQKPCGIRSREYYKDSQLYLSTEASPTTLIALREDGDLQSLAKESTRFLAHLEQKRIEVRIGTYNVWMMPRKVSAFSNVSPKKNTRARLIADVLPDCDVWVFTECFDHRARAVLLDKLQSAGYLYTSPTVGHKQVKRENMRKLLNGGVLIASKYPIVNVRIRLFKSVCTGADAMADKGVLYCQILKRGLIIHVFATHLQAWNDPASRAVRRAQLEIVTDFMRSMAIDPANDPVFFVGDLNVDYWLNETNGEHGEMLEILHAMDPSVQCEHARDSHDENGVIQTTKQTDPSLDFKRACKHSFDRRVNPLASDGLSSDGSLELLDYVLVSRSHRQPSRAMSWIQPIRASTPWRWKKQHVYDLSDHFPVLSSFTFQM